MASQDQRRVVNRIVEEAYNRGNFTVLDECVAPDFTSAMLPEGSPGGPEAFRLGIAAFRAGFPDLHFTIDDQIAEPGTVVNRWTMTGTHQGSFMGIEPTGKTVRIHGISIWYLRDDQVVDFWVVMDEHGLRQQFNT